MLEIVKALHEAFHTDSRWQFALAVALVFGLVFGLGAGLLAYMVDSGYQRTLREAASAKLVTPVVRIQYSSTQTVEISSAPGDHNEMLNLDNVATMIQGDEADRDAIGMILLSSPPLMVDKPVAGEKYRGAGGGVTMFPAAGKSGIDIQGATFSGPGKKYLFNRLNLATHVVTAGSRRFRVTLQAVRDKSTAKQMLIAYTFAISED